jgi:hypothetical protein
LTHRTERSQTIVLVAIDTGSRRPVKILRARPTRHFLFLLVRCRCGKRFGHRADRATIVCYHCGRMAALRDLRLRRTKGGRAAGKASMSKTNGKTARSAPRRTAALGHTGRRTVPAPAKRQTVR